MEEKKHFHHDSVIKLSDINKVDQKMDSKDISIKKISFLVPVRIEYHQDNVLKSSSGSVDLINQKAYFDDFDDISALFFEALSSLTKVSPNEYVVPNEGTEIMEDADKKIKEYNNTGKFNE